MEALYERQRHHPPVSACPDLARVRTANADFHLYVGSADAAKNSLLMQERGIGAVLALGTKALSTATTIVIDILDMEEAFLMQHFDQCFSFLKLQEQHHTPTLVHCAYGQSRSAAICVAFLMHHEHLSLRDSYDRVQAARPCIYINSGFLAQLELFEAMQCHLVGTSSAHATYRLRYAYERRLRGGSVAMVSQLAVDVTSGAKKIYCKKCNLHLGSHDNIVHHNHKNLNHASSCGVLHVEPLAWMQLEPDAGKLTCPRCNSKVGQHSWMGVKCVQGTFSQPAIQLSTAKVESR
ncbi:hypothetical protein, variant [Aphanomyces invadans]|uniref:protein-tyrosine-phosphatase n=1 Tax=Aphanomyces invadans TaxID=157072 RepID=A0A024U2U9_9STRA|nr:hypothetical protein H310_07136 [Aphanomyces invadans]XP_008870686.1 hypothetical protein, variant [Aphanomyces invadans]ETW00550.1 hypothetical protein H310_07136 [Aphanomyces invadans]ETW00551.1 hypothetical protein, variant [Aphanomyces invadans]|eukprot:XP_008870685.1 hypothetical protein H310_07136 [Aphanomyces invadans]